MLERITRVSAESLWSDKILSIYARKMQLAIHDEQFDRVGSSETNQSPMKLNEDEESR